MAIDHADIATKLGKLKHLLNTANTARGTTVYAESEDVHDQYTGESNQVLDLANPILTATLDIKESIQQQLDEVIAAHIDAFIEIVDEDVKLPVKDLENALREWLQQMIDDSYYFDDTTVSATPATVSATGNGELISTLKREDGKTYKNPLAEVVNLTALSAFSFQAEGEEAELVKSSERWPKGSGASTTVPVFTVNDGILTNGGFDTEPTNSNVPEGWTIGFGTPGTNILLTSYEVQRIVISGSPTAGHYQIKLTHPDGTVRTTQPIVYNAEGSAVQTQIRAQAGFESVTVSTTGTTPNFTHDITYTGIAGNLTELTVVNNTTGGTFTPSTVTSGSSDVYGNTGRALHLDLDGNDAELLLPIPGLLPSTVYGAIFWVKIDSTTASQDDLMIDLYDGSVVIQDDEGTSNQITLGTNAMTASYAAQTATFITPKTLPAEPYLRILLNVDAGITDRSVFIDSCILAPLERLYLGGPAIGAFEGSTPWVIGDREKVTVANNRGGELHEALEIVYNINERDLIFPTSGSNSLPDATYIT